jgi:hypothetical protein
VVHTCISESEIIMQGAHSVISAWLPVLPSLQNAVIVTVANTAQDICVITPHCPEGLEGNGLLVEPTNTQDYWMYI